MKNRLQTANIFAAVMLALYGGFSIIASIVLVTFPQIPYPVSASSVVLYLFGFGAPVLAYCIYAKKVYRQPLKETLSLRPLPFASVLVLIAIAILIQPVMSVIAQIAQMFFNNITSEALENMSDMPLWLMLLTTAVLPAIFEELVCRGMLLDGYKETPVWYQLLLPGLFFGFLHMNFQQISYAAVMGIYFAAVVLITRSLWSTMIIPRHPEAMRSSPHSSSRPRALWALPS